MFDGSNGFGCCHVTHEAGQNPVPEQGKRFCCFNLVGIVNANLDLVLVHSR